MTQPGRAARSRLGLWLTLPLLLALAFACGDDAPSADNGEGRPASVPVAALRERLPAEVWARAESADWFSDGNATPDGARLLEALASAGPLVTLEHKLAILDAHPDGLSAEIAHAARQYSRMTVSDLDSALVAPWLLDGLDDYERAVLAATDDRTIGASALRLAIERRFFEDLYDSHPEALTARRIDAVGSLSPIVFARAEQEPWFQDGLDDFGVSLLGILADLVRVEDAIAILDQGSYRRLELADSSIAVVFLGPTRLRNDAFALVQESIRDVEAFAGPFLSVGLILDLTPVPGSVFCHASGGSQYSVGYVALTGPGCYHRKIVVHEIAHAFIGGRFPAWFSEGIAEVVTYHIEGESSGYGDGIGQIVPDGFFFVGSPVYLNQASLGTDFLLELYDVAGAESMSAFVQAIAGQPLTGQDILRRIGELDSVSPADLTRLFEKYFGRAPPGINVPPSTPRPATR